MIKEPAAWLAVAADGSESSAVYLLKEQADAAAREWGWMVVPLYALPVLRAEDEIAIDSAWERTGLTPTWPADEAGCGVKYANAMAQEIERLRQFDRLQPIEPAVATPPTHATPCEGSLQGEGTLPTSYRDNDEKRGVSDTKRGPVAWAILHADQQYVSLLREMAEAHNVFAAPIVPLYRSPTLTNEERAAIYRAEARLRTAYVPDDQTAATLRKLLERMP